MNTATANTNTNILAAHVGAATLAAAIPAPTMKDIIPLGFTGMLIMNGDNSGLPLRIQNELRESTIEQLEQRKQEAASYGVAASRYFTQEDQAKLDKLVAEHAAANSKSGNQAAQSNP